MSLPVRRRALAGWRWSLGSSGAARLALGVACGLLAACTSRLEAFEPVGTHSDAGSGPDGAGGTEPGDSSSGASTGAPDGGSAGGSGIAGAPSLGNAVVWHSISSHKDHTCVLRDGAPWCWGRNQGMTFGPEDRDAPTPVLVDVGRRLVSVSVGNGFSCGLDDSAVVLCWGENDLGQLGQGDFVDRGRAVTVSLPEEVRQLSLGNAHACAVTRSRKLWCWGNNTERQLGIGGSPPAPPEPVPVQVSEELTGWTQVSCGGGHTCAVREGELWCWGRNRRDELGLGEEAADQRGVPTRVGTARDWSSVSAAFINSCGSRADGSAWCWGDNSLGQLGLGDQQPRATPARLYVVGPALDLQAGNFHGCLLLAEGDAECWGWNEVGNLGLGDLDPRPRPTLVPPPGTIREIAVGWQHTCFLDVFGQVTCTGSNEFGQLGTGGSEESATSPVPVVFE